MNTVKLTLACGRYDRTQPLIDGRVQPEVFRHSARSICGPTPRSKSRKT
jgi:hypothetical protein